MLEPGERRADGSTSSACVSAPGGADRLRAGAWFKSAGRRSPLPLASAWAPAALFPGDVFRDAANRGLARVAAELTTRSEPRVGARRHFGRRTATAQDLAQTRLQPALRLQP